MSTRDTSKKARRESGKKGHPFIVPENEIRDYVENLGVHDVSAAATRFQIVADLTKGAVERLARSDLQRIKQVANEDSNGRYRRIMETIIVSTGQGSRGINAAHLTANVAVQTIFRWSREYFSALNYRDALRRQGLDRDSQRSTRRQSALRLAAE